MVNTNTDQRTCIFKQEFRTLTRMVEVRHSPTVLVDLGRFKIFVINKFNIWW